MLSYVFSIFKNACKITDFFRKMQYGWKGEMVGEVKKGGRRKEEAKG
jgi:hypothetical protein